MNNSELVQAVATRSGVSQVDVIATLAALREEVVAAVSRDEKVTVSGLATFEAVTRAERQGRNPKTGEALTIPAHRAVKINAATKFKESVKG